MYEHFRNELISKLSKTLLNQSDIQIMLSALDSVANGYEFTEKTTELALYNGNFPKLAELFLQSKKLEGLSDNSLVLYHGRLRIFFDTVQKLPEEVITNDIRCFLVGYQKRTGISDRTLDKFRQIINVFYTWLVDEEYITKNPCRNIKEIKYEVKPRKSLTRMELEIVRRACTSKRDLAIVDTLYSTGCRVSELANMRLTDINTDDKSINIVGKGKKHNTCYFNTNAQLSLNEYIATRTDNSPYLFVSVRKPHNKLSAKAIELIFRDIAKKTDIVVTPHIMRHTCATLSLQSGMPLPQVQRMLGHASSDTTLIYAEISSDDIKSAHIKYVI